MEMASAAAITSMMILYGICFESLTIIAEAMFSILGIHHIGDTRSLYCQAYAS